MLVNIKFVNLPGPQSSGKYGSIVTVEGTKVMVPADLLPHFRSGMSCEIGTKEQTWGSTPVIVATSGPGGVSQSVQGRTGYQGGGVQQGAQRSTTGFQPQVIQGGGGGLASGAPPHDQARHIFVTGVVGRAMGGGKFTASEIAVLTSEANRAYDLIGKPPAAQAQATHEPDNFNDPVSDL